MASDVDDEMIDASEALARIEKALDDHRVSDLNNADLSVVILEAMVGIDCNECDHG